VAYIGTEPVVGQYRLIDDISGSFNGSTTTFNLQVTGTAVTAGSAQQLLVSLGGVIQAPGIDYIVSTNSITFTTAPTLGLSFFAILMGDSLNIGSPSDGTVTASKLSLSGGLPGQTYVINTGGTAWTFGFAGATGGGSDQVFYENGQTVNTNYTLTSNKNAMSAGPITIASGVTVTIPSGSTWTIV
jgi:hypothetical protein